MDIKQQTYQLIDDLKAVCHNYGMGNDGNEYKVITQIFLYKFLNDKFGYEIKKKSSKLASAEKWELAYAEMSEDDRLDLLDSLSPDVMRLNPEHLIFNLWNQQAKGDFDLIFDSTMVDIADKNIDIFSTQTTKNTKIPLFEKLTNYVTDDAQRAPFARALVDKLVNFSFEEAFSESYDFFSGIFEYVIKDYNTNGGGVYAEYYTPHAIAVIMARLLVGDHTDLHNIECYDPAAGTGTLLMALAHQVGEDKCTIFAQDRSQKSNKMLKLNLILNGLVSSLDHAIQGDTLTDPYHKSDSGETLRQFDYIVCNPPFNLDFSETREQIAAMSSRFWAGVPKVPDKDKKGMTIYTCFIQHVINSIKDGGKAAIVVPTPFLTKGKGIEKNIRKYMVDNKIIRGVITMPMNVFSTTGTKVSVLFLEKTPCVDNQVFLLEASGMGHKDSDTERNQKTVLSDDDQNLIVELFSNRKVKDKLSVSVSFEEIEKNEYRLAPSSYFKQDLKYEHRDASELKKFISTSISKAKIRYSKEVNDIAAALFNYWFVQFEFPVNGKPYKSSGGAMEYNTTLDMEIPTGWKVKNIQRVCNVVDCLHSKKPDNIYEDEKYYLLQLGNILEDGSIDVTDKYYISAQDYETWTSKIEIHGGDFVVTNAGRTGAIGIVPEGVKCGIGRNMTAIRPVEVPSIYMAQFLNSPYMQRFVASNLDESSFFKSFNVKSIKKINVLVPDRKVLEEYKQLVFPLMNDLLNGLELTTQMTSSLIKLSEMVK
jgi:type I restriction enzyme M protein